MSKKQKVIFLLDSGAVSLSYHYLLVPSPMTRLSFGAFFFFIFLFHLGHIWPAPRALFYPASGLLLGRPPLLSLSS
jgi:hypothetical protein